MNFVEAPSVGILSAGPRWVIFVVRDEGGNEILKVENKTSTIPAPLPGSGSHAPSPEPGFIDLILSMADPLVNAVTELHNLVSTKAKGDIEKAIDILDTL